LDENFAGAAGFEDTVVKDGLQGSDKSDEGDGWLRTGGGPEAKAPVVGSVHTLDASGNLGDKEEEDDEIPDMEDEEDDEEAIIRDAKQPGTKASVFAPCIKHRFKKLTFTGRYAHIPST